MWDECVSMNVGMPVRLRGCVRLCVFVQAVRLLDQFSGG